MAAPTEPSAWIIDADDATFQRDVAERSRELPIVIDFWAEWCQPCRMLGPILEQLAREYDGKFLLAKVETEKAPNIAAAFNVQSIPAVYGLRDGQLVDFFVGLLPENQIRSWIDRLLPSEAEQLVAQARAIAASDAQGAEEKLRQAIALDANLAAAKIALVEVLIQDSRPDEAAAVLAELEARGYLEPEAETLKSKLHLAKQAGSSVDLDALRKRVAEQPADLAGKLELAAALAAGGQPQEALEAALAVVQAAKQPFVEQARVLMVDLFRVLDDQPELVTEYRRKLSTALY